MLTATGLTLEDFIESMRSAEGHFLKHLAGLSEGQWTWKPYPECKNIIETLQHLINDERAALESFQTGKEPEYEALDVSETDRENLLKMLEEAQVATFNYLRTHYSEKSVDTEICIFGGMYKMAVGLPIISSEYYYHAGQVAYIRMATDPSWNYYAAIYG